MKTRNGFVSNSSSSSFVVAFNRKPKTKEELRDMMFPRDMETVSAPYDYGPTISVDAVLDDVFEKIKEQKRSASLEDIRRAVDSMHYEEMYSNSLLSRINLKPNSKDWKDEHRRVDKLTKRADEKTAKEFYKSNREKFILIVEYGDDTGHGAAMEHGDVFRNLNYVRNSNH